MYHPVPFLVTHSLVPQGLWLGACHYVLSETLQFLEVAGVDKFIVFPEFAGRFYCHFLVILHVQAPGGVCRCRQDVSVDGPCACGKDSNLLSNDFCLNIFRIFV